MAQFRPLPVYYVINDLLAIDANTVVLSATVDSWASSPTGQSGWVQSALIGTVNDAFVIDTLGMFGDDFFYGYSASGMSGNSVLRVNDAQIAVATYGTTDADEFVDIYYYSIDPFKMVDLGGGRGMNRDLELVSVCADGGFVFGTDVLLRGNDIGASARDTVAVLTMLDVGYDHVLATDSTHTHLFVVGCDSSQREIPAPDAPLMLLQYGDDDQIIGRRDRTIVWSTNEGLTWQTSTPVPCGPSDSISAFHRTADGSVVVAAGDGTALTQIYIMDPAQGTWSHVPLATHRYVDRITGTTLRSVTLTTNTASTERVGVRSTLYRWDPTMSAPTDATTTTQWSNIAIRLGEPLSVPLLQGTVTIYRSTGERVASEEVQGGMVSTAACVRGLYLVDVSTTQHMLVMIY